MSPVLATLAGASVRGYGLFGAGGGGAGFESIATVTVGSGGSQTITFSSIPGTYVALQFRMLLKATSGNPFVYTRVNGDTGSNYVYHLLWGTGSLARASGGVGSSAMYGPSFDAGLGTTYYSAGIWDFHDYASTTRYKTTRLFTGVDNNGSGEVGFASGLWMNTNAITSVTFDTLSGTNKFAQDSVVALYGIKGAA